MSRQTSQINAEEYRRDFVVVGASAGGIEALRKIFSRLPANFPAVIAVVLHRSPFFVASDLPWVLSIRTPHTIVEPGNAEPMKTGRIYVAPRDHHLVIDDGRFCVNRGPKQHFTRPAIDPLFLSAAQNYGRRVVGVILSGGGDDGVDGLLAIKAAGGLSIAQDPAEAKHPPMPHSAILFDHVDLVLPAEAIADILLKLASGEMVPRVPRRISRN